MRFLFFAALAFGATPALAQSWAWDDGSVPYVTSPMEIVDRMMRMAQVGPGDVVYDLGSGDGRIVIAAAKRGARGLGVDLDPELVALARKNAAAAGVSDRAVFEQRDLFKTDLAPATVVTMYLLPELNAKLLPRLLALKPGTRVVSHDGGVGDWPPDERLEMRVPEKAVGGMSRVELWIVPANARGTWSSDIPEHGGLWTFRVAQRYQQIDVDATAAGRDLLVRASRLRGDEIKLAVSGVVGTRPWNHLFEGRVAGERIEGTLTVSDGEGGKRYPWIARRQP